MWAERGHPLPRSLACFKGRPRGLRRRLQRGCSGAGKPRRPSQHGPRSGTLITQSALAGSRVPPTPGRVRPQPGLEDTPAPRPPALGRAGSRDAERGGRIAKGLPARGHLPAPGRGTGPRPRNWGHPVGLGSKPGHQAANSLVTGRAAAGAISRGTTLDGFPSRPLSPPSSWSLLPRKFKCRKETGAWEELARPLVCSGWQPTAGQGFGGGWSRRAFCSPSSAALLWTLAIFPSWGMDGCQCEKWMLQCNKGKT